MTFTKIKNFTEKDEIRIKAAGKYTENNTKSGQLAIYIGGEVYLNFFGDDKKIDITYGYSPITKERTILLSKLKEGKKGYSSHITGNGHNQTRKLVISVGKYFINKNDYNNKPVNYVVNKNGEIELYIDNIYSKRKTKDKVYFEGGEVNVNDIASKIAKNIKPKKTKVFKDNRELSVEPGKYINIEPEFNELILKELKYLKEQVDLINEKNKYLGGELRAVNVLLKEQNSHLGYIKNMELYLKDVHTFCLEDLSQVKDVICNIPASYNRLTDKIDSKIKDCDTDDKVNTFYKTNPNANIPDTNLVHNIELIKIIINSEMRKIIKEYDKNAENKDKRSLFSRIFGE
jgi:hypothetical protein